VSTYWFDAFRLVRIAKHPAWRTEGPVASVGETFGRTSALRACPGRRLAFFLRPTPTGGV